MKAPCPPGAPGADRTAAGRPPAVSRRRYLQASTLVLTLGFRPWAWGAAIMAVRVWPAQDYSRVTIESDSALKTTHTFVPSPPRLAVDIEGIDLSPALRELVAKVKADDPFISGVRVGQNAPGVVRLVLDLKQPVAPQVFNLTPVAAYQHRLVFDLYPAVPQDPLEALIQERLQETPKAPTTSAANTAATPAPPAYAQAPKPPAAPTTHVATLPAPPDPLGELLALRSSPAAPSPQHRASATGSASGPGPVPPKTAPTAVAPPAPPSTPTAANAPHAKTSARATIRQWC